MEKRTVSLIGMPGAGKSTVGVLLAKELGLDFVDSDLAIQVRSGATLQQILDQEGYQVLRKLEEETLLAIPLEQRLIATGGSAVYSEASMARLAQAGPIVFIDVPLEVLLQRVDNEDQRGIARSPGQDFADVFNERRPLYTRYADLTVDGGSLSAQDTARAIQQRLA